MQKQKILRCCNKLCQLVQNSQIPTAEYTALFYQVRKQLRIRETQDSLEFNRLTLEYYQACKQTVRFYLHEVIKPKLKQSSKIFQRFVGNFSHSFKLFLNVRQILLPALPVLQHFCKLAQTQQDLTIYEVSGMYMSQWFQLVIEIGDQLRQAYLQQLILYLSNDQAKSSFVEGAQYFSHIGLNLLAVYNPFEEKLVSFKKSQVRQDRFNIERKFNQLLLNYVRPKVLNHFEEWSKKIMKNEGPEQFFEQMIQFVRRLQRDPIFNDSPLAPLPSIVQKFRVQIIQAILLQNLKFYFKTKQFNQVLKEPNLKSLYKIYCLSKKSTQFIVPLFNAEIKNHIEESVDYFKGLDNSRLLQQLLKLHLKLKSIHKQAFQNDSLFGQQICKSQQIAYQRIKNMDQLLNLHIHRTLIIRGQPKLDFSNIFSLYNLLASKDSFFQFYYRSMSKRLLEDLNQQQLQKEKQFIKALGQVQKTSHFLHKPQKMIEGLERSKELVKEFCQQSKSYYYKFRQAAQRSIPALNEHHQLRLQSGLLTATVLSQYDWPQMLEQPCPRVQILQELKQIFNSFFFNKFSSKVLKWKMTVGISELLKESNILRVTNVQFIMILMLQQSPKSQLKLCQLKAIPCKQHLFFLNIYKLLQLDLLQRSSAPTQKLGFEQYIRLNLNFQDNKRVMIDCKPDSQSFQLLKKQGVQEENDRQDQQGLKNMREMTVKSVMVRFLKKRKSGHEKDLLFYAMQKITIFKTSRQMAEDCLRQLVEAQYFQYDKENSKVLNYRT